MGGTFEPISGRLQQCKIFIHTEKGENLGNLLSKKGEWVIGKRGDILPKERE